jgi:hypothetical protein
MQGELLKVENLKRTQTALNSEQIYYVPSQGP